jgi:Leucine-rich repeat (LRR) protein
MLVKTLAPLAALSKLESLDIRKTEVESLEPIIALPKLRNLSAEDTPLSDDELNRFIAAVPGRQVNALVAPSRV